MLKMHACENCGQILDERLEMYLHIRYIEFAHDNSRDVKWIKEELCLVEEQGYRIFKTGSKYLPAGSSGGFREHFATLRNFKSANEKIFKKMKAIRGVSIKIICPNCAILPGNSPTEKKQRTGLRELPMWQRDNLLHIC